MKTPAKNKVLICTVQNADIFTSKNLTLPIRSSTSSAGKYKSVHSFLFAARWSKRRHDLLRCFQTNKMNSQK